MYDQFLVCHNKEEENVNIPENCAAQKGKMQKKDKTMWNVFYFCQTYPAQPCLA